MTPRSAGPRSRAAFRRARRSLVGGVDSPVRAFTAVGGNPVFFARRDGAYLEDVDGRRYLDLVGSWGANILGNTPAGVVRAVRAAASRGLSFGAPSPEETELAERIRTAVRMIDLLRFVNSGTEAVMSAIRAARGFTRRSKILKFEGGYHGHSDGLLVRAGSGVTTHAAGDSAGVPDSIVQETLVAPYNDLDAAKRFVEQHSEELAGVIVEPIAGNMNLVPPVPGFLPGLEQLCRQSGALLIADEVITGFRLRRGVIHPSYGIDADLVTLGKVIGGGLPIGAYGGRAAVMERVAPLGPVYQAGTLSGNPVVMAAGNATLDGLTSTVYDRLERTSAQIEAGWTRAAQARGVADLHVRHVGSMLGVFFGRAAPHNLREAKKVDRARYARFFHSMLAKGVYLPPSPLETTFVSAPMNKDTVNFLDRAFAATLNSLR